MAGAPVLGLPIIAIQMSGNILIQSSRPQRTGPAFSQCVHGMNGSFRFGRRNYITVVVVVVVSQRQSSSVSTLLLGGQHCGTGMNGTPDYESPWSMGGGG